MKKALQNLITKFSQSYKLQILVIVIVGVLIMLPFIINRVHYKPFVSEKANTKFVFDDNNIDPEDEDSTSDSMDEDLYGSYNYGTTENTTEPTAPVSDTEGVVQEYDETDTSDFQVTEEIYSDVPIAKDEMTSTTYWSDWESANFEDAFYYDIKYVPQVVEGVLLGNIINSPGTSLDFQNRRANGYLANVQSVVVADCTPDTNSVVTTAEVTFADGTTSSYDIRVVVLDSVITDIIVMPKGE